MGSLLVRVGRATESVLYFTQGSEPTDLLAPAIDASVARLRSAQVKGTS